ncbi:MAG: endonuclease [Spirochaetota bacterium]|jgi:endonuclease I|nr:endonuclease [Spirochaetota bacterium]
MRQKTMRWGILVLAAFCLFAISYCGKNWLDNAPDVWITKIEIDANGAGFIEGVASGQVHTVYVGLDTYDRARMLSVTNITRGSGGVRWHHNVSALERARHTVYACAASGSDYGALRSRFFVMDDDGYEQDFEGPDIGIGTGASEDAGSVSEGGAASAGDTTANYDFNGNIALLRNAIATTTTNVQTVNNITVTGIVHASKSAGIFWIQDQTAGIYFYATNKIDIPNIGDRITLTVTKGQNYNSLKEVIDYTGYSVISGGNSIYRQTGIPAADKQGQAWLTTGVAVASSWANRENITVGGVQYRNDTGSTIPAGTYRITGPVGQYNADMQIMVWPGGYTAIGGSVSAGGGVSSGGGVVIAPPVDPNASFAVDAAKPAGSRPYNNYYASCYGKTGTELKQALQSLINGHTTGSYDGLYDIYLVADMTPDGKVWDIYSDLDGTGLNRPYTFDHSNKDRCGNYAKEGDCYNREHMIPQSMFGSAKPMYCDAHHVIPTDGKVNGMRSNLPHAAVGSTTFVSRNGTKVGTSATAGLSGKACEPINVYKGDTARIYFYFSLRYNGNTAVKNWETMTTGAKLKSWAQTLYREWNRIDPVSDRERVRNTGVQQFQKNRNPFIDYPEFADMIDFTS